MRSLLLLVALTFTACASLPGTRMPAQADGPTWAQRYSTRSFPSVASPWVATSDLKDPKALDCRHDVLWREVSEVGLLPNNAFTGLADGFEVQSIQTALKRRADLLACNPHAVLVAEVRYRDAGAKYLPVDSPWWKRAANGALQIGYPEGPLYLLDYSNPDFQDRLVRQCVAIVQSGVFDGCFFDWWKEDPAQISLIKKLRAALGPDPLILVNVNERRLTQTARYINGVYMEGLGSKFFSSWRDAAANLIWFKKNLAPPALTVLESWYTNAQLGRKDFAAMRFVTALSLIFGDGVVLFADPNSLPTPDHLHDWYPFWSKTLGRPVTTARLNSDGTYSRDYENGTVILDPIKHDGAIFQR